MFGKSDQDMQSAFNGAVKMQLAMLDVSVAYWKTVFGQSVAFTEYLSQTLESLQSSEPQLAQSVRRFAEFGIRNSTEFGRLSIGLSNVMLQTMGELNAPNGRHQARRR